MQAAPGATLVIINENPSLAAGLSDLFEAEGYRVCCAKDLRDAERLLSEISESEHPLLVAASNGHYSPAVNGWREGRLSAVPLVVVGSRDPGLRSKGLLHVVHLPLNVARFLAVILAISAPADMANETPVAHDGTDLPGQVPRPTGPRGSVGA